jgi:hypothetical protein
MHRRALSCRPIFNGSWVRGFGFAICSGKGLAIKGLAGC